MTTVGIVVEIPKGSRNKYEYDSESGVFRLDRVLYSSVHYPADYGFIPETLGGDGDTLDALVLIDEPTFTGCHIEARPIGLLQMTDDKGEDEKVLCVPIADPLWRSATDLSDVPQHLLTEIEHFFATYKMLEGKAVKIVGWKNADEAWRVIDEARKRFK